MNRRGFATEMIWFVVIMFVIALAGVIAYEFFRNVNNSVQGMDGNIVNTNVKTQFSTSDSRFHLVFDGMFLTLLIGGSIGLMVTSYLLRSNPILFWFMMIIVMLLGAIAGNLSNAFITTITGTQLSTSAALFPMTSFVMANYLVFIIILGFLMIMSFFGNTNAGYV